MSSQKEKSKRWITDALIVLMGEKELNSITVTEIVEKADVVRKTFYRHFSSKEEVLQEYINSIYSTYIQKLAAAEKFSSYIMAKLYFEYMGKHEWFLKLLEKNDLFVLLLNVSEQYIEGFNEQFKGDLYADYSAEFIDYYNSYNVSGMWSILRKWIASGQKETPDELAKIYEQILTDNPHQKIH